jgi:FdrA protein
VTADLTDFGDDEYTQGRAHPMLDHTLRIRALEAAAADPSTAVVLMDVVLGRGAHPDPSADLAPAIRAARTATRSERGRALPIVVSLCGTSGDPQGLEDQAHAFVDAGAAVYLSNAEAARAAGRMTVAP